MCKDYSLKLKGIYSIDPTFPYLLTMDIDTNTWGDARLNCPPPSPVDSSIWNQSELSIWHHVIHFKEAALVQEEIA